MSTTEAEAHVMAATAAKFDHVGGVLELTLKRLMIELEVLRTQWQGAGGRSFEQVKEAWAEDQQRLHHALSETADAIRRSASHYAATDESATHRLSPVRTGGMTLPL